MNLQIAICDDEQLHTDEISAIVAKWSAKSGHSCELVTYPSAEAFLFAYEDRKAYDILLLDIEMKEMSGIDLAKRLRSDRHRAEIIFITSHFEFYGEGYEVDALHYLLKPVAEDKLCAVLDKAAERLAVQPPSIIITCEGETVKLLEEEILYVEAMLHYLVIVTGDREYRIKEKISVMEERLSDVFYRSHRSYLVSLKHIIRISRAAVQMANGAELPLARGKYDEIHYAFISHN